MPLPSGTLTWDEWVSKGFPRKICDHIWETLDDGTILCFECDQIKKSTSQ